MTSENTRNADAAQHWLDLAAKCLESVAEGRVDLTDGEYVSAAAAVGFGYSQLAHLDFVRAERVEDLERLASHRADDLERIGAADARLFAHYASIERAQDSVEELARAQLAVVERRDAQVLDKRDELIAVAQARRVRASGEARNVGEVEHPRFVGFTEHGHPVVSALPPHAVVACGGPSACGACADDTGDLRRAAREAANRG